MHIEVQTHKTEVSEIDAVWEEVLNTNPNITINQIKDGIRYGWYYLDIKSKPRIEINQYNKHLWRDNG